MTIEELAKEKVFIVLKFKLALGRIIIYLGLFGNWELAIKGENIYKINPLR